MLCGRMRQAFPFPCGFEVKAATVNGNLVLVGHTTYLSKTLGDMTLLYKVEHRARQGHVIILYGRAVFCLNYRVRLDCDARQLPPLCTLWIPGRRIPDPRDSFSPKLSRYSKN